jgi:Reverse transcriptase (RNA-dependent DNA polymerase)
MALMDEPKKEYDVLKVIEQCRNNIRYVRATSKPTPTATFATFQGSSPDSAKSAQSTATKAARTPPTCVYGVPHWFADCPYLIKSKRPAGWVVDKDVQVAIDSKIANNLILKSQIDRTVKRSQNPATGSSKSQDETGLKAPKAVFATSAVFTVDRDSYELKDSWILDSGANSHVCNDSTRFNFDRKASKSDTLISGKTVYQIEAFGNVEITVQSPNGPLLIILANVALVPGFFTSIASLNRFTSKGVHWDTQGSHLHKDGKTFCTVERVGGHWALEHRAPAPSSSPLSAFPVGIPSNAPRKPISAPLKRWHAVMGHPGAEPLSHLEEHTMGAKIEKSTEPSTPCEACAVSRATEIVSRRTGKTPAADEPIARVAYDLVHMTPAYNNNQWISHFRDYYTKMDFVYTHHTKGQATAIVENFLNLIKTQYQLIPRHFRTDGETSLGKKFSNLMGITKARCLRNGALLPAYLWPEIVRTAAYLHNRTLRKALGWKTLYEALTKEKPDLSYLHVFGCRAYPYIKNIPRKDKLEPRAHLGYLVGYDLTNIYRIWVPSIERVLHTRDVTFNDNQLYDPHDLDIGFALREEINRVVDVMETPDAESAEYEIDDEIEDLDTTVAINLTASSDTLQAVEKAPTGYLPTPEQTPVPDNAPPGAPAGGISSSMPPPPETSSPPISADFNEQNILPEGSTRKRKPRQQIYAAQLATTSELSPFYAAFATGLSMAQPLAEKGQHRDTLPAEPKNWKQLKNHLYSSEFKLAADKEIQELAKRGTYEWVLRGSATSPPLPLLWVFKYKFNTDGYLTKFKARLCVRGDLQTTEQDTYAATLAARTFRALIAISAAFDLEASQFDAVNAFVNSDLDEEIYCQPLEGY